MKNNQEINKKRKSESSLEQNKAAREYNIERFCRTTKNALPYAPWD